MLDGRHVLLIIAGGVAAYKGLETIRRLQDAGAAVTPVLTAAGREFVTPLAAASLAGRKCYTDLFSLTDEAEMGHIQLARAADLVLVAPATADLLAKMAGGHGDDLASTLLLATDKPVAVAPAMNPRMWAHPATAANMATLERWGIRRFGPGAGEMACGESGDGRMRAPEQLVTELEQDWAAGRLAGPPGAGPEAAVATDLAGRHALVTSGPTHEPVDAVRYLGNRSSGRQGHAIAAALAARGARVTLVTGPTERADPAGCDVVRVTTAEEMLSACVEALPADIAICCAAVSDWRVAEPSATKRGKDSGPPQLRLTENPDILASLAARGPHRPRLVVGFAAETGPSSDVCARAEAKRQAKNCDWLVANAVAGNGDDGVFGSETNTVHLLTPAGAASWPSQPKTRIAAALAARVAEALNRGEAP